MSSKTYWEKREAEALKHYLQEEQEYQAQLREIYRSMLDAAQKEIDAFYGRYADKEQIKAAVEKVYGVTVKKVNTIRYAGKVRSRYTKAGLVKGHTNAFKKAIVEIAEGQTIDFYNNI